MSNSLSEKELLEEFEKILNENDDDDDFGFFCPAMPPDKDLEYPDEEPPPVPKEVKCDHKDRYINEAGGKKFYVCPDCKADLGDA